MSHITLNRTNDLLPKVGYGLWKIPNEEAEEAVYNAIKAGYRLLDGAAVYGNEVEVGRGIKKAIQEGVVKREDLFVVTKLWNNFHHKDRVRPAFDRQLEQLGLDYVDLYLIHFPVPLAYVDDNTLGWEDAKTNDLVIERSPIQDTWRELEKLVDAKLARNIGISNFNVQTILDLLTYCKYKPALLQVELHPYLQQPRLVKWVQSQGIAVMAYSSFGPISYLEMTEEAKSTPPLLENSVIKAIANKHQKSPSQVLLRWSVQKDVVVIPKSLNPDRMRNNLDVLSWTLDEQDLKDIAGLDQKLRFNDTVSYGLSLPLWD
ncbi:NAD(P)H-dependent D-xylose reductase (XR) [Apophysomyces sp. BC1034]|nr:NAD(P)H-dependent D-xylose reductase (XR) [Apophysomyces sp. BC1015]KAG0175664.1 NAD(P)H-dependent D-xylose reductase (XR) [Apophysomyces sp. BC1021]KAG0186117.1 NAD(P)H-dependent D-xylose reductase (XR) [Apophysomyces sp. BC1034]